MPCLYLFSRNTKNLCLTSFDPPGEQWTATGPFWIVPGHRIAKSTRRRENDANGVDSRWSPLLRKSKVLTFSQFQKCKLMGMKTSWVLTEEDKTKLAMRRESSPIAGINVGDGGLAPIHIKKVMIIFFLWYPDLQLQWRINRNHSQIQTAGEGAKDVQKNQETVL